MYSQSSGEEYNRHINMTDTSFFQINELREESEKDKKQSSSGASCEKDYNK
jgi:hypothetical protein